MAADFAGPTAGYYAMYRRDVPGCLLDAVVLTARITSADWILDLGCGTGQVAAVLASRVGGVLAIDPEPDMLGGLRARLTAVYIGIDRTVFKEGAQNTRICSSTAIMLSSERLRQIGGSRPRADCRMG